MHESKVHQWHDRAMREHFYALEHDAEVEFGAAHIHVAHAWAMVAFHLDYIHAAKRRRLSYPPGPPPSSDSPQGKEPRDD